jgi:serine protease inhibitor
MSDRAGWKRAAVVGSLVVLGLVGSAKEVASAKPVAPTQVQLVNTPNAPRRLARGITMNSRLLDANNRFGFTLFSAILKQDSTKNVFVSPASVAFALSMVYNGANGETQQAMAQAMNLQGMSLAELNNANADLRSLLNISDPQVQLAIANSLWARQGIPFKPDFLQRNRQYYGAQVKELDFGDPRSVGTINQWVSASTRGKIDKIIDRINPNDLLYLINAVYFKGNWTRQFEPQQTTQGSFFLANGQQKQHPLMTQSGEYRYTETDQFQAVSLPYGEGQRLSMIILLPKQSSSLAGLLKTLNAENWETWMSQLRSRPGAIQIPKFKLEYDVELTRVLSGMGMASAFGRKADFSALSQAPAKIDEVKHKTFVEVNEEGTEAAAVTSIGIRATSAIRPQDPFKMVVNRPFFCAIRDNQTQTVLFMGAIANPSL